MQLGHLLTRSGLTYPEVSSKVCLDFFCQLENSVSLHWVIYYDQIQFFVLNHNFLEGAFDSFFHSRDRASLDMKIIYRVIHNSLRDFRPLRYSSRDGHAEGEHVNRGRDTPSFCPTLQLLDMFTLGDAADVNPVIKFLRHALQRVSQELLYTRCKEESWL
jgi:hypothetical protein